MFEWFNWGGFFLLLGVGMVAWAAFRTKPWRDRGPNGGRSEWK
jgi:hypothetical protein